MSDPDIIRFEVDRHIALVTLNRPPVNALDRAMRDRLIEISTRYPSATTSASPFSLAKLATPSINARSR